MELTIPIYVEARREAAQKPPHYVCQPLFHTGIAAADVQLGKAMTSLTKKLKLALDQLGALPRHDDLSAWSFSPELRTHIIKLKLDLRTRMATSRVLWAEFTSLDRRLAFSPTFPDLWFELAPREKLSTRATEVLTRYYRKLAGKRELPPDSPFSPEMNSLPGQAWVSTVTLDINTRLPKREELEKKFAALFDESKMDGGVELQRVGRCLNWLYPDELSRAVLREREVGELARLIDGKDRRPIALVGPRLSGKTAVLHEYVFRAVARRKNPYSAKQNVWLLSPQRLISGMMYVGQWENRLLAILKEAKKRRHVLYFDDFLGLFHAGISRDASLCAADVLKPFLHRRDVRIVAEFTTEAWHALEERDRGLADQFHVLPIPATDDDETLRVMLAVHRHHEAELCTEFALDALPAILELSRRYMRDAAFPGKSASFSRHLARKFAAQRVGREHVYGEFHERTGLAMSLIDRRHKLTRDDIVRQLRRKIVGQDEAVDACADVVSVAKAGLNAPGKPLATLLFLGPTGVGKTECAKALAEVLFSSDARLLRFDMNEYVTPYAVAQLVGTFAEPDGLLSGAVRRQPFAVVLLDEIEKSHPDVFDLLLQVTGEGRLTDALGRTADFSNCVVVMTSNLGVATAGRQIGLVESAVTRRQVFVRAAEGFFRPEFFNRIDRIVPFTSLARDEMQRIAQLVLQKVFQRDGLVRRRCALDVTAPALERIVDAGYHPQYGARALKRAIEQHLLGPVAATLSGAKPELPAVIGVYPSGQSVAAHVQPLDSIPAIAARPADVPPERTFAQGEAFLERMEDVLDDLRPAGGASVRGISPEQLRFYALKEQLHRVREGVRKLREQLRDARSRGGSRVEKTPGESSYGKLDLRNMRGVASHKMLVDMHSAQDIHAYLQDIAAAAPRASEISTAQKQIVDEAALLEAMLASSGADEVVLIVRPLVGGALTSTYMLANNLLCLYSQLLGFEASYVAVDPELAGSSRAIAIAGPCLWNLATREQGVHLLCRRHENLTPVQVSVLPVIGAPAVDVARAYHERAARWLADLSRGAAAVDDHPDPPGRVVRIYDGEATVDLRTSLSAPRMATADDMRDWLCAGLPLPEEFS